MVGTRRSVPIDTPDASPNTQLGTQSTSTIESTHPQQQNQACYETTTGGLQTQAPFQDYRTPYRAPASSAPNTATFSFAPNQGTSSSAPTTTISELSARSNQVQADLLSQIAALKNDVLDRLPHPVPSHALPNPEMPNPQQMAGPPHDYAYSLAQQHGEPPLLREIIVSRLGIPAEYIRKIFNGTFKPIMLSKLVLNSPNSFDMEQDIIRVEDGQMVAGPAQPSMKSFGSTIQIWLQGFENYLTILCQIHGAKEPGLLPAMMIFKQEVEGLSRIYKLDWVLKMALSYHAVLTESGVTNPASWRHIPQTTIAQFCNPNTVKPTDPKPTRPTSQPGPITGKRPRRYCYSFQKESGLFFYDLRVSSCLPRLRWKSL